MFTKILKKIVELTGQNTGGHCGKDDGAGHCSNLKKK